MPVLDRQRGIEWALLGAGALALAACQPKPAPVPAIPVVAIAAAKADQWRTLASPGDADRLDRLGLAWSEALAEAQKANPGDVRREGDLLRARGGLDHPAPTPGSYNCRLIELGRAKGKTKGAAFTAYRPFFCYVETDEGQLTIIKQTGSQRPSGRLWDDDDSKRMIFLGSMAMGERDQNLAYGDDSKRDLAGTFERVGPFRWRLVIPWPQDDKTKLDIYELTPVADQPR